MEKFFLSLIALIIGLFHFILVLRAWLQFCRVDPRLPISQTLIRFTAPVLDPLNRLIPTVKRVNLAALLLAVVLTMLKFVLFGLPFSTALLIIGVLSVVKTFGEILFFTTLIRALMSWITQGTHPLDYVIAQITEPVLGLIRRILPRTGMLDFSVMVLGIILILLNNWFTELFGQLWLLA